MLYYKEDCGQRLRPCCDNVFLRRLEQAIFLEFEVVVKHISFRALPRRGFNNHSRKLSHNLYFNVKKISQVLAVERSHIDHV